MSIVINIEKAKAIGHDIRRQKRAEEFAPYDEIIAKQIPGVDAVEAEIKRQEIREKYADMQTAINEANSPEQLKQILGLE